MKVRLDNTYSPCSACYAKGICYDSKSLRCQRCEYNIAVSLLKHIMKLDDICSLEWKAAFDEYGLEYINEVD